MAATSADAATARDPIFGLTYDTAKTCFERAPSDLASRCPGLVNERFNREMYVFAHVASSSEETFIIGGFYVPRSTAGPDQPFTDPKGVLLTVSGNDCKLLDPADETFSNTNPPVGVPVIQLLASDALRRYILAFGSLMSFKDRLRVQHIMVTAPALREAIKAARPDALPTVPRPAATRSCSSPAPY